MHILLNCLMMSLSCFTRYCNSICNFYALIAMCLLIAKQWAWKLQTAPVSLQRIFFRQPLDVMPASFIIPRCLVLTYAGTSKFFKPIYSDPMVHLLPVKLQTSSTVTSITPYSCKSITHCHVSQFSMFFFQAVMSQSSLQTTDLSHLLFQKRWFSLSSLQRAFFLLVSLLYFFGIKFMYNYRMTAIN